MKTLYILVLFILVDHLVLGQTRPASSTAIRPGSTTQPVGAGWGTPQSVSTTPNSDTVSVGPGIIDSLRSAGGNSGVSSFGVAGGQTNRLFMPKPAAVSVTKGSGSPKKRLGRDVILDYDLCADGKQNALSLYPTDDRKRNERRWHFFRAIDNVRMRVVNVNPSSYTITLSTMGLQNEYVVNASPMQTFSLAASGASSDINATGPAAPTAPESQTALIVAVQTNQHEIKLYTTALREARRKLAAQVCITEAEIESNLDGQLAGAAMSRIELQSQQEAFLLKLRTDNTLKKEAEDGLVALQNELNQWAILRAGMKVLGPVMPARDKDYIRFEVKRLRMGDTEAKPLPVINIPVYGNFRLNVSTGFIVSGLVDYRYLAIDRGIIETGFPTASTTVSGSTTVITTSAIVNSPLSSTSTSTKVPVCEDPSRASIGVGALLHAHFTCPWAKGNISPALSFGASLNANGRYTVMAGGSLIFGGPLRLVLTGGYAIGPVTRLQQPFTTEPRREKSTVSQLESNRTMHTAYEFSGAEFPTVTQTQGSWFVGITFNMSSKRNPILPN